MSKNTDSFYNKFSLLYPIVDIFLKPQKIKLFQEINNLPFGQLLEIGIGNGTHLPLYNTHKVIGIDTSKNMLKIARKQKLKDVKLIQMNGENLLFKDQTFDYIVLSHVITVVDNPEKLLEESFRVLKPKGKIYILNHFTPNNWLSHIDYYFQIISKIFHFKSFFQINSLTTINKFKLLKEVNLDKLSYFKLLIYTKA
jgi:phosphatidylethanolamine/phosphatidyl-N-methylethanolamine N-methyltransferase